MDQPIPTISLVAPSPKTNWLLFLVGGIVILGLGIGIGLFLAKNIYPPLQILPTPLPAEALAKEGDPTPNLKKYNFSSKTLCVSNYFSPSPFCFTSRPHRRLENSFRYTSRRLL